MSIVNQAIFGDSWITRQIIGVVELKIIQFLPHRKDLLWAGGGMIYSGHKIPIRLIQDCPGFLFYFSDGLATSGDFVPLPVFDIYKLRFGLFCQQIGKFSSYTKGALHSVAVVMCRNDKACA
jgi:hypothetical protein